MAAWVDEIALRQRGRFRVLAIWASNGTSCIWMRELAEAEQRAVPTAVERRMGTVVGRGESATPDIAVRTLRTVRRDFESSR